VYTVDVKKDFGATDDTIAFQQALSSASKIIYIPKGVYIITSQLSIPSGVNLFGVSAPSVLIKNNTNTFRFNANNTNHYAIKNLKVMSDNSNFTGGMLFAYDSFNVDISNELDIQSRGKRVVC